MTRTVYTTVTPLPAGVTRQIVLETLHNHVEMIDLNPLVETRTLMPKPPAKATAEEYHLTWYELVDRISYLPGIKGRVTYHGCFHDLPNGLQTHVYAPMGLEIKDRWTVGGNEPGEPRQPVEFGINAPRDGLYLREDINFTVNMMMVNFVKKNLVTSHGVLVDRLIEKAKIVDTRTYNQTLQYSTSVSGSHSTHSTPSSTLIQSVPPNMSQAQSPVGHGYNSPSQVYDERYGRSGQGWQDHNAGPNPPYTGPAPPYDYRGQYNSDHKYAYVGPPAGNPINSELSPQDPNARYRMTLDAAANPPPQEMPTREHKPPVELE